MHCCTPWKAPTRVVLTACNSLHARTLSHSVGICLEENWHVPVPSPGELHRWQLRFMRQQSITTIWPNSPPKLQVPRRTGEPTGTEDSEQGLRHRQQLQESCSPHGNSGKTNKNNKTTNPPAVVRVGRVTSLLCSTSTPA